MTWSELCFSKINLAVTDMEIFVLKENLDIIEVDPVKDNEIHVSEWKRHLEIEEEKTEKRYYGENWQERITDWMLQKENRYIKND